MSQLYIEQLKKQLSPTREALVSHPLYNSLQQLQDIRLFMQYHVFAVWDFMSLLKSLQRRLTSVNLPWLPRGSANTRYLINEIVLGEESDVDEQGNRTSHFELYLRAMEQLGADTSAIRRFIQLLLQDVPVSDALLQLSLPPAVTAFVRYTFQVIENEPVHVQAAVFTFGREDLIPDLFMGMVKELAQAYPEKLTVFRYYLERHIEVDGGHHSHLALEMVSELCSNDEQQWAAVTAASLEALEQRRLLWDAVWQQVQQKKRALSTKFP